jgi:phytoene dehydrogenase-like protein
LCLDIETVPDIFMNAMEKLKQEGNPSLIVQIIITGARLYGVWLPHGGIEAVVKAIRTHAQDADL